MADPYQIPGSGSPKAVEGIKGELPHEKPSSFEAFMKEGAPEKNIPTSSNQITPMALAQPGSMMGSEPTLSSLLGQVEKLREESKKAESYLRNPNLKLKRSHQKLIETKLSSAKDHIRSAAQKLGVEIEDMSEEEEKGSPLAKFLGYLTHGESQIMTVQKHLRELTAKNKPLQVSEMLLIQAKMSQAQQEVEFSSILLSNVISGLKQIMSIQI